MTVESNSVLPRLAAALRRVAGHEWTIAAVGSLLLAALFTWPTLGDITGTIPQDTGDPTLQAWQIAWGGHALSTDPGSLWHSNTFYPELFTYAYSDTLLGYAPLGMIGDGPVAAIARYNILYVLVHALAFFGTYALVRQLGGNWIGAAVAGTAFAYAPWKLAQAGHMHVLSTGGITLALAMLARGHGWSFRHGYRPDLRRPGWAVAGWLVAAWQMTLGFGIGLPFGYFLAGAVLVASAGYGWAWWRRGRPVFGRRLLLADLAGGTVFAAVTVFMALPYLKVVELHPDSRRTVAHIDQFSPPVRGFFTAPGESWLWGDRHAAARETLSFAGEMTLLPGVTLIGLAVTGLFFSTWRLRHRIGLALGVLVSGILATGSWFLGDGDPGYVTLMKVLPGWDAMRTPGRLVLWTTLLLAILAAGAVSMAATAPSDVEDEADGKDGPPPVGAPSVPAPAPLAGGQDTGVAVVARDGPVDALPAATGSGRDGVVAAVPRLRQAVPSTDADVPVLAVPAPRAADTPARTGPPGRPAARTPAARRRRDRLALTLSLVPLALVLLEGVNRTPHPPVPSAPLALRDVAEPLLILPPEGIAELHYMLFSTDGFPRIANGLAAHVPQTQAQTRTMTVSFPDAASIDYLAELGVRTVVVLPDYLPGTGWQDMLDRPIDGLPVTREQVGGAVVFRLLETS
ncbi:hypothetical protein [Polymorphospora rubra]|uniref:Glycosyltransferase RgtA/B/C/D-like domain-containing protein n=1 Tax=Polymorphospora rubra TaxID=338584 RepID=A0A810MVE4_9ACTN|nr:hypothetical protein [Polymorphospora rubra]BCJ63623.1 hypothetical protein Prubr_06440 [Polymorphospora rubra]